MATRLKIKYIRSAIGYDWRQKRTVTALGLRKLGDIVEHDDTPAIRGMVHKVQHLVIVEEVNS